MLYHFQAEQWIPVAIEEVFRFFANPENRPRIMPPASGTRLLDVKIVVPSQTVKGNMGTVAGVGSEIVTSFRVLPFLPFRKKWTARIMEFEWNRYFADVQQEGPFKSFYHRHELRPDQRGAKLGTAVIDLVDYEIGLGLLDPLVNMVISRQMHKTFEYRQAALNRILLPS